MLTLGFAQNLVLQPNVLAQTTIEQRLMADKPSLNNTSVAPFKVPNANVLSKMIQTHMTALSNAIVTNNFSVLWSLGTPKFRQNNSVVELAEFFSTFRRNKLDISPVSIFSPILKTKPIVDKDGVLQLQGYYNTAPRRIEFNLLFYPTQGIWKLHGISAYAPPPAEVKQKQLVTRRTITGKLNLRAKPSIDGRLLVTLKPGEKVHVLGKAEGADWHQVFTSNNVLGFIKTTALQSNSK